jgi:pimeloyl-ACP methyl ester carboxylesterase
VRTIETPDGRSLSIREAGVPDGVAVLVQNGTPCSSLLYGPHVADAEAKGIRLFSYDRPGYFGSTRKPGRTVADCVADIETVCDALDIERFVTWGISGGGPHALACATELTDRCVAAAALAPPAPYGAEGLDFLAGMGEQNIEEFNAVFEGEERHREVLERDRAEILGAMPDQLVDVWRTLLGPADREVATAQLAAYLLEALREATEGSLDGWVDDDLAFTRPWGFELDSIRVPVLHWHGMQDKFVPPAHAVWLSQHIPGVDSRLTGEDGHLTLAEHRVPQVHDWLLERFPG